MLTTVDGESRSWTSLPARRIHDALRDHGIHADEVRGVTSSVVIRLDPADANRLATILAEAAR